MKDKDAEAISEMFSFSMRQRYNDPSQSWLFDHEIEVAKILLKHIAKGGSVGCDWVFKFILLNKENIEQNNKHFNFNLRQARLDGII